jgi:autotransporter-associated beta strand protein
MTVLYKRAGSGNWSAAASWSLTSGGGATGSVPTAADDVIVDAASGPLTIDGTAGVPSVCRSFDASAGATTITMGATAVLNYGTSSAGAFIAGAGNTWTVNTASIIRGVSTTTGNNITTNGKQMPNFIFDGVGGAWTLLDAFSTIATANTGITVTNGTFNTGNFAVSAGLSSSNANVRSIVGGTTTWTTPPARSWDIAITTNLTFNPSGMSIIMQHAASTTANFNGGGLNYGSLSCTAITTGGIALMQANTFGALTLSGAVNTTGEFVLFDNQTCTGAFTTNGGGVANRILIRSDTSGTPRTITAASNGSSSYCDFEDITGAGAAGWNLSAITGGSGDCGGNSGITFTTPANNYWVPSAGTSTGATNINTRIASSSGGTAGTGRVPLPQDTLFIDANSIDAGSRTVTLTGPRIGTVNATGATNNPIISIFGTGTGSFYGSLILPSNVTPGGSAGGLIMQGRGSTTIDLGGASTQKSITIDLGPGTLTPVGNITSTSAWTTTSGTFNGAAAATIGATTYTQTGGAVSLTGNMTLTGACNISGGTFTSTALITGGTTMVISGTGVLDVLGLSMSSNFTSSTSGAITIGASGIAGASFTKSGSGTTTVNGVSTMTGNLTLSGSGTLAVNQNMTFAGTMAQTGQNLIITGARITYNNGYVEGAGSGGGGGSATAHGVVGLHGIGTGVIA